jgi:lantibiotic modifying enzyme
MSFSSIYHNKEMPRVINIYGQLGEYCLVDQLSQQSEASSPTVLLPVAFLVAAIRALVVLYLFRFRWSYPHAFAVEPPLANVASNPELA